MTVRALAWRHRVHARQSESCGGVIELAVGPDHGVVTLLARRGKSGMRHWRGGVVVVVLVATDARRVGDVVVVVDVAIGALARRDSMRSGQWKCRLRMVEAGRLPRRRGVARIAGLCKPGGGVIRIVRVLVILQVARHASRGGQVVIVIHMAIGTLPWRHRMRPVNAKFTKE